MKKYLLIILIICLTLQAQTTFNHVSENQTNLLKANLNELKNENGINIINSLEPDSIVLRGEILGNLFGYSVSSAGDVNRDGYSDIIVGDHMYQGYTGRVYIFFGGELNNVADVIMTGESGNNRFGISVSSAGDLNTDGYADVIVGAPNNDGGNSMVGRAYIFFGGINMDGIADVILYGQQSYDDFGYSVSTARDVNGDGFSDVIVGAEYRNVVGRSYIFFGGALMDNGIDVTLFGETPFNYFGKCVSSAGDVNNDGFSDILVGAYSSQYNVGRTYIYYGGTIMNNIADIIMTNEFSTYNNGISVSTAGDVNGDGFSDVIIGTEGSHDNTGSANIFFGSSTMDNLSDLTVTGQAINDKFGFSVSEAGDINRDGYSDIIIGAKGYYYTTGRSYVFYGFAEMDSLPDVILTGANQNYEFGISVSSAGDANGDGFSDVIVGASGFNRAYLYTTNPEIIKINMKILFEGMYSPVFNQLTRKDTIKVYLRNASPPYAIKDSSVDSIDSISFSRLFKFLNAPTGNYYLVVKHFNCIETWSKSGGEFLTQDGSTYYYDFTISNFQAYWNNLKFKGSKYCLYSGDVNQDGFIDLFDVVPIYNGAINFLTGSYLATDLTGDNIVDLSDLTVCYNNSINFIRLRRP